MLSKVFKDVIACNDGQDGLDNYLLYTNEMNIEFDAIITDINMPNMNGLEMAKEIRQYDDEIPIITTTAHGEANYLLEAIKINITGYVLKPIDAKELILTIQKFCEVKRDRKLLQKKEQEVMEYINIINSIATLLKVDRKDNIIEVNDFFADMLKYDKNELIGLNAIKLINSTDIPKTYKQMKDAVKNGKTWKGKILFKTKQDETIPLRVTNIQIKDDNTDTFNGYISVGFLAKDEELEKRRITQQAKKNIIEEKQKIIQLTKKIKEYEKQLQQMANSVSLQKLHTIKDSIEVEKQKKSKLIEQVLHYEEVVKQLQTKLDNIEAKEEVKRKEILAQLQKCYKDKEKLQDELISARATIENLTPKTN
jgi:PAS domain S-box-containing protein